MERITVYKLRWTKKATGETGIAQEFNGEGFTDMIYAHREYAEQMARHFERTSRNTETYKVIACEAVKV